MFRKTQTETHSVSYETVKRMSCNSQPYIKLDRGFDWNSLISARNKAVGNLHTRARVLMYCLVCIGWKKVRNIDQLSNTKKRNEGNNIFKFTTTMILSTILERNWPVVDKLLMKILLTHHLSSRKQFEHSALKQPLIITSLVHVKSNKWFN